MMSPILSRPITKRKKYSSVPKVNDLRWVLEQQLKIFQQQFSEIGSFTLKIIIAQDVKDSIIQKGFLSQARLQKFRQEIQQTLLNPLTKLISSGQLSDGDEITVNLGRSGIDFCFHKRKKTSSLLSI